MASTTKLLLHRRDRLTQTKQIRRARVAARAAYMMNIFNVGFLTVRDSAPRRRQHRPDAALLHDHRTGETVRRRQRQPRRRAVPRAEPHEALDDVAVRQRAPRVLAARHRHFDHARIVEREPDLRPARRRRARADRHCVALDPKLRAGRTAVGLARERLDLGRLVADAGGAAVDDDLGRVDAGPAKRAGIGVLPLRIFMAGETCPSSRAGPSNRPRR